MKTPFIIPIVFLCALFISASSFAQSGAISSAETFLGQKNYEKAIEKIGDATYHKKTKDDPKMWYMRAKVYTYLVYGAKENPELLNLAANPVDSAFQAMKKVKELEQASTKQVYTIYLTTGELGQPSLESLMQNALFTVAQNNQDSNPEKSYEAVLPMGEYFTQDTTVLLYTGYFAEKAGKLQEAATYYEKLGDLEIYDKSDAYQYASGALYRSGDTTNFLRVLEKGQKRFPKESYFILNASDVYMRRKDYPQAIALLEKAHSIDPNTRYLNNIARMYQSLDDSEKAMEYYDKSYQMNKEDFDVAYALGAHYYRHALDMYNKLADDERIATDEKMKPVLVQANKSIPYFEQAITLDEGKEDASLFRVLSQLYDMKGDDAKAEEYDKKYKAMKD